MMTENRNTWKFHYTIAEVLVGAQEKLEFHKQRVDFWTKKKEETVEKIRSSGLEFNDTVSDIFSNSRRTQTVTVDDRLSEDLRECNDMLEKNVKLVREYSGWVEFLDANIGMPDIELTQADWLYFFSKPQVSQEDKETMIH